MSLLSLIASAEAIAWSAWLYGFPQERRWCFLLSHRHCRGVRLRNTNAYGHRGGVLSDDTCGASRRTRNCGRDHSRNWCAPRLRNSRSRCRSWSVFKTGAHRISSLWSPDMAREDRGTVWKHVWVAVVVAWRRKPVTTILYLRPQCDGATQALITVGSSPYGRCVLRHTKECGCAYPPRWSRWRFRGMERVHRWHPHKNSSQATSGNKIFGSHALNHNQRSRTASVLQIIGLGFNCAGKPNINVLAHGNHKAGALRAPWLRSCIVTLKRKPLRPVTTTSRWHRHWPKCYPEVIWLAWLMKQHDNPSKYYSAVMHIQPIPQKPRNLLRNRMTCTTTTIRKPSTLHGNNFGGCGGQRVLALSRALSRAPTSRKIDFISLRADSSEYACVTPGRVSKSAHVAVPEPLIAHVASTWKLNDNRLSHCRSHPEHTDWWVPMRSVWACGSQASAQWGRDPPTSARRKHRRLTRLRRCLNALWVGALSSHATRIAPYKRDAEKNSETAQQAGCQDTRGPIWKAVPGTGATKTSKRHKPVGTCRHGPDLTRHPVSGGPSLRRTIPVVHCRCAKSRVEIMKIWQLHLNQAPCQFGASQHFKCGCTAHSKIWS